MMKKLLVALVAAIVAAPALAGNGAPSGTHYNLNILGKDNCAGSDLTGSNRHTIQVLLNYTDETNGILYSTFLLDKTNKIMLAPGTDFQVTDGNACDKGGAGFTLPADVSTAWEVYARALGKPGGSATMTTCAAGAGPDGLLHTADDEIVCSTENVLLVRNTGKSTFKNVTNELTTIYVDTDGDGVSERYNLFSSAFYDYFWDYDNQGLRLAQLRFYPR